MRIEKNRMIGALPARVVRQFVRRHRHLVFTVEAFKDFFSKIADDEVHSTWQVLCDEGFIGRDEERDGRLWYELTVKGNALAQAKAANPISRTTAEKRLQEFMARVEQVNQDPQYAFKITRVALFGSMLSKEDEMNDIDLAIQLEFRLSDKEARRDHVRKRIELAASAGRRFRGFIDQSLWPQHEVFLFLKARSPVFSIHGMEDLANLRPKRFKMLLGEPPLFEEKASGRN